MIETKVTYTLERDGHFYLIENVPMGLTEAWLGEYPWDFVVAQNAAVSARKPVLASSGSGPLKTVVEKYHLGVFVAPDNPGEILKGVSKLVPSSATGKCEFGLKPDWDKYEQENSWEENARKVRQAFES